MGQDLLQKEKNKDSNNNNNKDSNNNNNVTEALNNHSDNTIVYWFIELFPIVFEIV